MAATNAESGQRFGNFGRRVDVHLGEWGPKIEGEVKRVIAYLNDDVVPEVRRNSSTALRAASRGLARMAEHLDQRTAPPDRGPESGAR
jgi:hypothetical protein